jgi:acyl-CoA thioesterase-1
MSISVRRWLSVVLFASLAILGACTTDGTKSHTDTSPLYVAIGASDTVGTGARNPGTEGWVAQLHQKMPAGTRLANLGIGSLLLHQALDQVLPVAVDLRPSVVTVWLAVNDLASGVPLETYHADLDTLLGTFERETDARVYVANIPDLTVLPAFQSRPADPLRREIERWNETIAVVAAAHRAVLVDLYAGWSELRDRRDYISRDGLHPSTLGHRRLAELFWAAIGNREQGTGDREVDPARAHVHVARLPALRALLPGGCTQSPVPCSLFPVPSYG